MKLANGKRYMPKELGLFCFAFLTVPLYIQWEQFIIFQFTLPTPSNQVPSNFMFAFKRLRLNLLNIVTLLTLKVVIGDHPTRPKNINYIQIEIFKVMKIFWMFTSRCFRFDWWLTLLKNIMQYLLCCLINMEENILQSQIACHTFLCFSQPRPL